MCTSPLKIKNPYNGQELYVPCGSCPSCKVSRASSRTAKILNNYNSEYNYFFVTFTYDSASVPYIFVDDFVKSDIPIYRGLDVIDSVSALDCPPNYRSLPERAQLRNFPFSGCAGVLLWSDLSKMFKRLRKILSNYGFEKSAFSYYSVSEYGETFFRPHFHVLFKTRVPESLFRSACCEAWPLCDWDSVPRAFERAVGPARYLSLYLASFDDLPRFYTIDRFKPRKSHSLGFGFENDAFSFLSVYTAAKSHNLTYNVVALRKDGSSVCTTLPLPRYVISRYFPKFKGFSKLSYNEFLSFCCSLNRFDPRNKVSKRLPRIYNEDLPEYITYSYGSPLYPFLVRLRLTAKDVHSIVHSIGRVYSLCKDYDIDFFEYLSVWYQVYTILFSHSLKCSLTGVKSYTDFKSYYYNYDELLSEPNMAPSLVCLVDTFDNQDFTDISNDDILKQFSSQQLLAKFNKNKKIKKYLL